MRIAVIDLGSNTFHLLIVEVEQNGKFKEIFRKRQFTGLCEGGIDILLPESIQNGLNACCEFRQLMLEYQVEHSVITGTAALRSAKNKEDFIHHAENIFGKPLRIIDGLTEAALIFKGIALLIPFHTTSLIIDIGGGSTECIIVKDKAMVWSNSYVLGVGVMHAGFHQQEPIGIESETSLRSHIRTTMADLLQSLQNFDIKSLVGASGSFEVFESMSGLTTYETTSNAINVREAKNIIRRIINASYQERCNMNGMPLERVKYIVVAMILIDEILSAIHPDKIIISPYALKEGLIAEIIEGINSP